MQTRNEHTEIQPTIIEHASRDLQQISNNYQSPTGTVQSRQSFNSTGSRLLPGQGQFFLSFLLQSLLYDRSATLLTNVQIGCFVLSKEKPITFLLYQIFFKFPILAEIHSRDLSVVSFLYTHCGFCVRLVLLLTWRLDCGFGGEESQTWM